MITNCKECHREVSDTAPRCPHCGAISPAYSNERPAPGWHCQACGFPREEYSYECPACGSGLRPRAFCVRCGVEVGGIRQAHDRDGQVYCFQCWPVPCGLCGLPGAVRDMVGVAYHHVPGATGQSGFFHHECLERSRGRVGVTQESVQTQDGGAARCFVATAVYGSPMAQEVQVLREYRDSLLARTARGRHLIHAYNGVGPALAHIVAGRPVVRALVRRVVLAPTIALIQRRGKAQS